MLHSDGSIVIVARNIKCLFKDQTFTVYMETHLGCGVLSFSKERVGMNSSTFINSYNTFEIESRGHWQTESSRDVQKYITVQ